LKGSEIQMLLEEANARLKSVQLTDEQLWQINSIYCILNLDKDDFCKIVDLVGFDKLAQQKKRYERYDKAEQKLAAKERYLKAKARIEKLKYEMSELECEKAMLEDVVKNYNPFE